MKRSLSRYLIIALIFFFPIFHQLIRFVTDWWWYGEIHNTTFFWKSTELQLLMFLLVFLVMSLPSLITILVARRLAPLRIRILEGNVLEYPGHLIRPYLFPLMYGFTILISFFFAIQASSNWNLLLPLFAKTPFHITDPIFNHDVGFYVFYLPLYDYLCQLGITSLVIALILASFSYGIQKVLKLAPDGLKMAPVVSSHISILLGLLALLKALGYRIGMYNLLLSQQGAVYGIGYADFHARLPLLQTISVIAALTALILFANIKLQNWKPFIGAAIVWGIFSIFLAFVPKVMQQLQVLPSELDKERAFLENNIRFTREAYGLNTVKETRFEPTPLTPLVMKSHQISLENIRLWDLDPLRKSLGQLQEIRPYYTFANVDVDRYVIGSKLRQVMIAPRELDYGGLQNHTWANEHLIFTHGYGFVATPVNQVTPEGLPDFFVKNIPPAGVPELHVDIPEIYYGESENDYCIVNSKQEEFNYPSGDQNNSTHYHGAGGVELNSLFRKLAFASRFSGKIFFSSDIDSKSRIMYYRTLSERMNMAFPLLLYDHPYPVIDHEKIYWICDAYTINDHYPYAHIIQFHGDAYNYIRNSVKVVIDAYNGTMNYYVSDPSDPIITLYSTIFPKFFSPLSQMPESLRKHLRVPEDLFMIQAKVYSLYHMTNPDVFYNREDLWQIPQPNGEEGIRPYYVIMQFPGSSEPEFLLMLPFTPNKKDNLAAWITARCDEKHYGEKLVFAFPKESLVYGPNQILARINQDPKFSQLRTLWGQQGSRITLGHLQVIPLGSSVLYVAPLYLKAEQRELPELKLVLLAYADKIAIESNLEKALAALFTNPAPSAVSPKLSLTTPHEPTASSTRDLVREAIQHYQKALDFQKRGDWGSYGQEIKQLGDILQTLNK